MLGEIQYNCLWHSVGLVIGRSRVRSLAVVTGEFSSLELTLCASSYFGIRSDHSRVTAVARKRPRSFCQKCRWQVTFKHAYTLGPAKSERTAYAVQASCWESIRKTSSHATRQGTLVSGRLSYPFHITTKIKSKIAGEK